jgi:lysozyme
MKPSKNFYDIIVEFEGLKLKAYLDSANVPTIGIGTIKYPNGLRVKMSDTCTKEQAFEYLEHDVDSRARYLTSILTFPVTQNQYDALLSLMYNIGIGGFYTSTAFRRIKKNPYDPLIKDAWMMWTKAGGKTVQGLVNRRKKEIELYFKR